jgi:hypothetical protein
MMVRYLGSTKNLVGSVCGLVGVALYLFGVTGPLGLPVVAALYAVGALLAPPERVRLTPATPSAEISQLRTDLATLIETVAAHRARMPDTAVDRVERIGETLTAIMARDSLNADPETLHAIIRLARVDLPLSVQTYLNLPWRLAARIDGREHNAAAELVAQLELLEKDADQIASRFYAGDIQQQTDHTRYIRSRTEEHPDPE